MADESPNEAIEVVTRTPFFRPSSAQNIRSAPRYTGPYHNKQYGSNAGGPFRSEVLDRWAHRQWRVPYRVQNQRGAFRQTFRWRTIPEAAEDALALMQDVLDEVAEAGHKYAVSIAPYYEGPNRPADRPHYRDSIEVLIDTTRTGRPRLVMQVPGIPWAIFVEYGGKQTPPHAVLRRTMDFCVQRLRERLPAFLVAQTMKGLVRSLGGA